MSYTVVVMPLARRHADLIGAWWRNNRPEAPYQFDDDLAIALDSLGEFPERGFAHGPGKRALLTARTRHRVIYRVRPRARRVEVIAIRGG